MAPTLLCGFITKGRHLPWVRFLIVSTVTIVTALNFNHKSLFKCFCSHNAVTQRHDLEAVGHGPVWKKLNTHSTILKNLMLFSVSYHKLTKLRRTQKIFKKLLIIHFKSIEAFWNFKCMCFVSLVDFWC